MTANTLMSPARKKILYVEGHEDSSCMLTALLGINGYEVATANTVADGLC